MKLLDILRKLGLIRENGIFYIGGSDVLPPPLKGSEELLTLQALEQGDEDARQRLGGEKITMVGDSSTISDWSCISPGGSRTPASIWKI